MDRLGLVVGALAVLSGVARAQEAARADDTVGFLLKDGLILVQARVNGKGPFTFVVDTGARVTVLSPWTAGKVELTDRAVDVDSIAAGKAAAGHVRIAVAATPEGSDGILGYTFLSR